MVKAEQVRRDIGAVIIPNSAQAIDGGAFAGCERLRRVFFSQDSQLSALGSDCFRGAGLTEITIPASIKMIGTHCFYGCQHLAKVQFAEGSQLKYVQDYAFGEIPLASVWIRFPLCAEVSRSVFDSDRAQ